MATRKKTAHAKRGQAPWMRAAPSGTEHRTLTPKRKAAAKARAKRAGRPYPKLVENMCATKRSNSPKKRESA